jgi:cytochrome c biogenesis protein CcmG/thiol:disulfide interchange protein DsbE|tara:strand:- start:656 stop:1177 length:522 start_codon:yes stop_codon:yes gene_type:complete
MFESTLRTLIVIIFLSSVILFTSLIRNIDNSKSQEDFDIPLPEFSLPTLQLDKKITNENLEDLFVLNVWASWCITCRVEHPFLKEISKTIPIIGLNYKDEKNNATGWLSKLGDPYIFSLYDYYGELALDLGVTGAPETFLVHKGRIISHHIGEVDQKVWSTKFSSKINKINND